LGTLIHRGLAVALAMAIVSVGAKATDRSGSSEARAVALRQALEAAQPYSTSGFAGYQAEGLVHDVAASFTVPAILPGSPPGDASTWIGVSTEGGEFIQVGVTEHLGASQNSFPIFDAFWSDTSLNYHPQALESIQPTDRVSVSMTQNIDGWKLSVRDDTTGLSKTFESHFGHDREFRLAEWEQEDPVAGFDTYYNVPYPTLSETTFSDLELNGSAPTLRLRDGSAMNVFNGPILIPTPDTSDSFSLISPIALQRQYLSVIAATNHFSAILFNDLRSPSTFGKARLLTDVQRLQDAAKSLEYQFADNDWGNFFSIGPDVAVMGIRVTNESSDLEKLFASGLAHGDEQRVYADAASAARAGRVVRSDLGLPPS
jgi:hypothetical protein